MDTTASSDGRTKLPQITPIGPPASPTATTFITLKVALKFSVMRYGTRHGEVPEISKIDHVIEAAGALSGLHRLAFGDLTAKNDVIFFADLPSPLGST